MQTISADKRRLAFRRIADGDETTRRLRQALVDAELALAEHLAAVDEAAHFISRGCASIGEYGAAFGLDPWRARVLAQVGRVLRVTPPLRKAVESGEVDVERAGVVSRLLDRPVASHGSTDWIAAARQHDKRRLKRLVNEQIESVEQQAPVLTEVSVHVTADSLDDFRRCRAIASDKAGHALSESATFRVVTKFYLAKNDPLRRKGAKRRMPDTAELAKAGQRGRAIPAEVRRAVLLRSEGKCEVRLCPHDKFLKLAHVSPHAEGGAREEFDLLNLCGRHHTMFDADKLVLVGWVDGKPVFVFIDDEEPAGDARQRDPPDRVSEPRAGWMTARAPPPWAGASVTSSW